MRAAADLLAALLLLAGAGFSLVAAIGLLRLPDLYTRMHAASKAGPVGAGLMLLALALRAASPAEAVIALLAIAALFLTAPVSAHLLAEAAHDAGLAPGEGRDPDALAAAERDADAPRAAPD